jgi:hypothetical protein
VGIRTVLYDVEREECKSKVHETVAQKIFETKKDKVREEFRQFQ